ncbi:MAG TPA: 16S rRNA (guanine(966)-N(2))-methyltransferase RsmD [Alphaproteobacteria bacterium]|nr:16S rRNA (guanine(966)-N(2))-methyltransferase RsmD [Alphaproteobacteria bacterium]
MRVVGGTLKGRALFGPKDDRVRPTSDKVREALFNIMAHGGVEGFDLEGARVLDLFAGTGALSIEALSRGAAFALLIDDSVDSRAIIRRNVEALNLTGVTKIWRRDAAALSEKPANAGDAFDLVFADPPYRQGLGGRALATAAAGGWIAEGALVILEEAADQALAAPDRFALLDQRIYGDTQVAFYRYR